MAVKHNALHQFAAGVNAAASTRPNVLPFTHPAQQGWKVIVEDFSNALNYAADSTWYEFTAVGSGTVVPSTGGALFDNGANADNEGAHLQAITPTIIPAASTKKMYLETSVTVTAATMASNEIFLGFSSDQATTNFVAADGLSWAADDCFGFGKLDAETAVSFIARQSDVEQTVSFGANPTTATKQVWSMYYDGATYFLYLDGVQKASVAKSVFNDDAAMGFHAYLKAGAAELQNMKVDYLMLAYEL